MSRAPASATGGKGLLLRSDRTTGELAFYRCWSPDLVPLHHLVAVAGRRWSIEESFQAAKTGPGLDQHQHRRWRAWHRWTTLVIAAHAFLPAAATTNTTSPGSLLPITVNELRRLFHALIIEPARRVGDLIAWSIFRRRQQAAAKTAELIGLGRDLSDDEVAVLEGWASDHRPGAPAQPGRRSV